MNTPPDRLCSHSSSEYFDPLWVHLPLVIKVDNNRVERCIEYCISGGWVRYYPVDPATGLFLVDGDSFVEEILTGAVSVTVEEKGFM